MECRESSGRFELMTCLISPEVKVHKLPILQDHVLKMPFERPLLDMVHAEHCARKDSRASEASLYNLFVMCATNYFEWMNYFFSNLHRTRDGNQKEKISSCFSIPTTCEYILKTIWFLPFAGTSMMVCRPSSISALTLKIW